MAPQQSNPTETSDASRVDHLLRLLGNLSQRYPSPSVEERLRGLASQRLKETPVHFWSLGNQNRGLRVWLKPALAAAFLLVIGLTAALMIGSRRQQRLQSDRTANLSHPGAPSSFNDHTASTPSSITSKRQGVHHSQPARPRFGTRQMTLRLPYSNSAIETGTDATIRVSVSQSELLSLGFPINTTAQDHRIVAELTLGDDGLPRAISVPLPLEVMKEKK
jgi:hypothetical protein